MSVLLWLAKLMITFIGLMLLFLFAGMLVREALATVRVRRSVRTIAGTESLRVSYDNFEDPERAAWERVLEEPQLGALGAKLRSIGE